MMACDDSAGLGIPWGMLSDRVGRRPILLNGLFGTMIGILMFGLSKSFYWALFCRSLCGLLVSCDLFV